MKSTCCLAETTVWQDDFKTVHPLCVNCGKLTTFVEKQLCPFCNVLYNEDKCGYLKEFYARTKESTGGQTDAQLSILRQRSEQRNVNN